MDFSAPWGSRGTLLAEALESRMSTACLKKHTDTQSFWSQSHTVFGLIAQDWRGFLLGAPCWHRAAWMAQLQGDALFKSFSQACTPTHICSAF